MNVAVEPPNRDSGGCTLYDLKAPLLLVMSSVQMLEVQLFAQASVVGYHAELRRISRISTSIIRQLHACHCPCADDVHVDLKKPMTLLAFFVEATTSFQGAQWLFLRKLACKAHGQEKIDAPYTLLCGDLRHLPSCQLLLAKTGGLSQHRLLVQKPALRSSWPSAE